MTADDVGIGLLVFDRPGHTQQVLDGLERNDVDHLYVFADGAGPDHDTDTITTTREVIQEVNFCDVDLVTRDENYGVQESWVAAYDHIFKRHKKGIMLEDDCVPAGDFVSYMKACLDRYEHDDRVMNVHGYCPPISLPDEYPYDVFFTWRSGSWGQGTWKDDWEKLRRDPAIKQDIQMDEKFEQAVKRAGWDLIPMLEKEITGEIDSIGVWWSLTLAKHDAVSINPVRSRIKNIGHDGSGSHSSKTDRYVTDIDVDASLKGLEFPPDVTVDEAINSRYNYYIGGRLRGKLGRLLERARRTISR